MKFKVVLSVVAFTLLLPVEYSWAVPCDPLDPNFVCGLKNAEDLVRLGDTPWIVASHLDYSISGGNAVFGPHGPVEAVRIDTHQVHQLYPAPDAHNDWDRSMYPDCSRPPEGFSSHGLNVLRLGARNFRLLVANHGGRESVEIIDVSIRHSQPVATWRGCIRAPHGINPNALAPLPHGGVALSGGQVAIWRPKRGWKAIEGIQKEANGIEASHDGRWLFVNLYGEQTIVRVPVAGGPVDTIFRGDFTPDNLRWGEDGMLYVAGQYPGNHPGWIACRAKNLQLCDVGFVVAQIDPATLATKEVLRSDGLKGFFGAATTALQVGDHFWLGSFWGDRVAILSTKQ